VTRPTGRTLALVLGSGPGEGATVAALRLAEHVVGRGHRVAVFAYGAGAGTAAAGSPSAPLVEGLIRAGVHGGLVSWVADRDAPAQVPGAVHGDGADLWRFVRDADVVLGVTG